MPQPVTLPAPASHRPIIERTEVDDAERAEQFSAFLRARAGASSAAAAHAGERARGLPPPARFDWDPGEGASSPPPWARAHEVANGKPFIGDAQGTEVPPVSDPAPGEGDSGTPPVTPPADNTTPETDDAPAASTDPASTETPTVETPPSETRPSETAPAENSDPATQPTVDDLETAPEPSADSTPADGPVAPAESAEPSEAATASFAAPLVETESTFQPNTPRYQDVPDSWKWPIGPYQQAPEEFGGEWWKVNPFTGSEPWKPVESSSRNEPSEEFLAVFGPRPHSRDFDGGKAFQAARGRWDQDLRYFKQSGIPEGFDESQFEKAASVFETWGMGRPAFYEGRYGWAARFPESGLPAFEANASTALEYSHLIVASFQTRQLLNGVDPARRHPFVPPTLKTEGV